jgi:hypothetical protein
LSAQQGLAKIGYDVLAQSSKVLLEEKPHDLLPFPSSHLDIAFIANDANLITVEDQLLSRLDLEVIGEQCDWGSSSPVAGSGRETVTHAEPAKPSKCSNRIILASSDMGVGRCSHVDLGMLDREM